MSKRDIWQEFEDLRAFTADRMLEEAREGGNAGRIIEALDRAAQHGNRRWERVDLSPSVPRA